MVFLNSKQSITFTIISLLLLEMAQAQRPFFAGARPPGLNQKDKYNMNNNLNNNNSNTDITNRFGKPDEVQLPFGATQKPPASFIPVVFPESNYLSLATPTAKPVPQFLANRFGGGNNLTTNSNSLGSGASTSAMANAAKVPAADGAPVRVPIDAKNDSELVAILSRLPEDQQPFWFINAAAIEAQRNGSFRNFAGAADFPRTFFG